LSLELRKGTLPREAHLARRGDPARNTGRPPTPLLNATRQAGFRRSAPRASLLALGWAVGAVAAAQAAPPVPVGPTLEMEPFFVAGSGASWRYAQFPGYEILSHYPDATTIEFLEGLNNARKLMDFIVPEEFQAKYDVPHAIILCGQDMMSTMSEDLIDASASRSVWSPNGFSGQSGVRAFPNVEAVDRDRIASLVTNQGGSLGGRVVLVDPGHLRYLLERRTPPLPPWLLSGVTDLYSALYGANKTTDITNADAVAQRRRRDEGDRKIALTESDLVTKDENSGADTHQRQADFVYRVPPLTWISPGEGPAVATGKEFYRGDGGDRRKSMVELFAREPPTDRADWEVWKSRAALFVRWALDREYHPYANALTKFLDEATADPVNERFVIDGTNSPHRSAFWRFASRAASEPVTEATFRECFGFGYAAAAARLADYLPVAVSHPIDIRIAGAGAGSLPGLRDATGAETARIKGDWERLAVADVKAEFHDLTSNYIQTALTQAYDRGSRDPRLLAVIGLFACDLGNDTRAAGFLEAAAAANVVGPRVYFELARIRYAQLRPGDDSRLSAAEVNRIIEPLEVGRMQAPPLREAYDLALKVFANSDGALAADQLAFLESGLHFFPGDMDLLYRVADVDAEHGHPAQAEALAESGARWSSRPEDRLRFARVEAKAARMAAPSPAAGEK
jgi:hypothetical protein